MRRSFGTVVLLALLIPVVGCYRAVINTGARPSMETIEHPWAMSFVGGLIPPPVVETAAACPAGVAKVETYHSFLNMLVSGLTGGIISPMSIKVTCAAGGMEEDADAADVTLNRDAGVEVNQEALTRALERAGSAPLWVQFE
jgi:hypothetical protein